MAESSGDKSEAPTSRRLRDAREKGQIPRSQDLTTGLLLAASVGVLTLRGPVAGAELRAAATEVIEAALAFPEGGGTQGELLSAAAGMVRAGAGVVGPILLVLALASLAFTFAQVGALVTMEPLVPKLERMNPIAGLKRMFFSMDAWIELAKSVLKLAVVGGIAYAVIDRNLGLLLTSLRVPPLQGAVVVGGVIAQLATWVVAGVLSLGLLDLFYQRWKHEKDLRMTKQEVKDEYKDQEGDPQHKAKRRRAHRQMVEQGIVQQVQKAHMVVTNPTHYACALRYDPDEDGAPRLLVKGQDHLAFRIIEMAKELKIPIVRNISLAHALYELEEDEEVPEELYDAAAELMRSLQELAHAEGRLMPWEGEGE